MPSTTVSNGGDGLSPTRGRALEMGQRAARTLTDVADLVSRRVRDRDWSGVITDARRLVQEKPGAALLTAALIGFVLARSLSRR